MRLKLGERRLRVAAPFVEDAKNGWMKPDENLPPLQTSPIIAAQFSSVSSVHTLRTPAKQGTRDPLGLYGGAAQSCLDPPSEIQRLLGGQPR